MIWAWWAAGLMVASPWAWALISSRTGLKTIPDLNRAEWDRTPNAFPRVTIVVPARNEEERVSEALASLCDLDYPNYEVIAIDDRSTDATGELMDRAAARRSERLRVLHLRELPAGWLGKTHAMWLGAQQATGDWILFTDADIHFRADALRRAMACVEQNAADHFVLFPRLIMDTVGERAMYTFFQMMFVFGHRPWKVADPNSRDSIGLGAFNLIRRRVYEDIGTYAALRMAVVDDIMLGEVVKRCGFAQRCAYAQDLLWLKWAHGAAGVIRNFTKNFFAVLRYKPALMIAAAAAMAFLNVLPFAGVVFAPRWAKAPYAVATAAIALLYIGVARLQRVSSLYFLAHPVSAVLFIYAMLRSTVVTLWRGGVVWRGTKYPLAELRAQHREVEERFPARRRSRVGSEQPAVDQR